MSRILDMARSATGASASERIEPLPLAIDDGVFAPNRVVSVESYIGARGAKEGVKLEQQVLITVNGPKVMSTAPFEDAFAVE